jgi:hypothetical protein
MGEQIWSSCCHNIRLREPVHLLPVGRPLQLAQHTAQPDYCPPPLVQCNGRTFPKLPEGRSLARCAAANWVDNLAWVLLGLRAVAREDNSSTPAQAVFGSPLILPGQFLDSPELPSKIFLEQFSKTLSAAEHLSNRHNTAAARRPPPQLPNDLVCSPTVFVRQDGHVPPLQLLYDGP